MTSTALVPSVDNDYIDNNWKLVYIEEDYKIAFFVEGDIQGARGDDWDNAPYAHNAGAPYGPTRRLMFDTEYHRTPDQDGHRLSVDEINGGDVPWLKAVDWLPSALRERASDIKAGVGMADFVKAVLLDGTDDTGMANVYAPVHLRA